MSRPRNITQQVLRMLWGLALWFAPVIVFGQANLPPSVMVDAGEVEKPCDGYMPEWKKAQVIDEVKMQESLRCMPDSPQSVAAFVKGTNNISMDTLMDTYLATDAVIKKDDVDGDGDPDHIIIKLEVVELNGHSPDYAGPVAEFDIAPGIKPGMWVFAPKTRGMSTESFVSNRANPMLRAPSPAIRVEQGDRVWIQLENTHYFPHTIHLHGVDHAFVDSNGEGNDGVPQTSEKVVMPGESRTYEITPRQSGTMVYHCHVQTHTHLAMGLVGMFIVEENRPNNWLQTMNVGGGKVRHPSVAVSEDYGQEYDLHYHALDAELHNIVKQFNDPRMIAKKMNRIYDMTDSTEDYYTLNGRSFPFTLRESLITVEPNENVKLRMFNSSGEVLAVHTHGHKATITHYDGIEHNPSAQITRDVYDLAPAQRIDLALNTKDDGLHSYGEGIWIFHDHREKGITTNGMNPGGNVSAVVYKSYLNEMGMPKAQGVDLSPYFSKAFYERKLPVWQGYDEANSLGEVEDNGGFVAEGNEAASVSNSPSKSNSFLNFITGLILGTIIYFMILNRELLLEKAARLISLIKSRRAGE
ncbi:MAG: multicopper oxidase domain-containing protein [Methylococcaceae bacterium]